MTQTYHAFLCAGLGNRLFQYASVKGIAKLNNVQFNIIGQEPVGAHDNNSYEWLMNLLNCKTYQTTSWNIIKNHFEYHKMGIYEQPENEHLGHYFIDLYKNNQKEHILLLGFFQ
jgi:hypothetical protein